ncbi:pyridine nucleotide-disulfide oxidoreductase [Gordonia polyisoprenivorans]|uniref:pyridine nucleotide-disulfide oxidoreductase n=1 Tax=Gordonia polyisoprenivorans TaxID=84595 RepID=UPI000B99ECB0|nr:pyridine nucleotide-disulfide oxidoreductase [Gordonia polyisoprenivorans]OZC31969.1 pyridine nucleotide-disulfide oxidoreductase [Gordonia polyisoprenivorans]UZF55337.1 pyridine nucleotide-disulfide oxidoreductase [Gordonia polyisoprenivorans]
MNTTFDHQPVIEPLARPGRRLAWRAAVVAGCLGFALVAACDVSLGSDAIDDPDDIGVGECLALGPDDDPGKVAASAASCEDSDGLTFYVARQVAAGAECDAANTSTLTFGADRESLCLTPNFATGKCYRIPIGGDLADYREVDCGEPAQDRTIVARAVQRGDETITCADEDTTWSFRAPKSIGYCLREV